MTKRETVEELVERLSKLLGGRKRKPKSGPAMPYVDYWPHADNDDPGIPKGT